MKRGYVYITSNRRRTTFYIGATSDLRNRIFQHRIGKSYFTSRYKVDELVYFEEIDGMRNMLDREKQLKNWHRDWKINLVKSQNPEMKDLSEGWFNEKEIEEGKRKVKKYSNIKKKRRRW